jgi:hypothetical protein
MKGQPRKVGDFALGTIYTGDVVCTRDGWLSVLVKFGDDPYHRGEFAGWVVATDNSRSDWYLRSELLELPAGGVQYEYSPVLEKVVPKIDGRLVRKW